MESSLEFLVTTHFGPQIAVCQVIPSHWILAFSQAWKGWRLPCLYIWLRKQRDDVVQKKRCGSSSKLPPNSGECWFEIAKKHQTCASLRWVGKKHLTQMAVSLSICMFSMTKSQTNHLQTSKSKNSSAPFNHSNLLLFQAKWLHTQR